MAAPLQPRSVTTVAGLGLKRIPACTEPIGLIPSANRSVAGWMALENRRKNNLRSACGSKELDPLSRFPMGKAGVGMVPPTPRITFRSQPKPPARLHAAAPRQEGFAPLRDPPCPLDRCVPRWLSREHRRSTGKDQRMAATSALTFMTFSFGGTDIGT